MQKIEVITQTNNNQILNITNISNITNITNITNMASDLAKLKKVDLLIKCKNLGLTASKAKTKSELITLISQTKTIITPSIILSSSSSSIQNKNSDIAVPIPIPAVSIQVVRDSVKYNFIEVCAGGGGLSSGLIKAGLTPLLLNDNNKDCCATLKANHTNANIICSPMEKLDLTEYINKVDVLAGGIPCQSYSQSGLRKGLEDPRGQLIYTFINMIKIIKPKIFVIENVKGLLTHNNGLTIKNIIELLNPDKLYDIKYQLLNAYDYGVPQKRERVFIVGLLNTHILDKNSANMFIFPEKHTNYKVLKDVLTEDINDYMGEKYNELKKSLFSIIPQGGCWINLPEEKQISYLGKSYLSGGGKRGILHRLSMEKPSLTLLCTPAQKQTERCHPLKERPLNIREYARIQTFPDTHIFTGSMASQYKQIGNAVPVELAYQIGVCLVNALNLMNID